jgi:hypothetical protein
LVEHIIRNVLVEPQFFARIQYSQRVE